jgi:hypothetical protein
VAYLTFVISENIVLDNVQSTSLKIFCEVGILIPVLKITKLRHRSVKPLASHSVFIQTSLCLSLSELSVPENEFTFAAFLRS